MPLRVPSELVRIVDYIYARGMDEVCALGMYLPDSRV